MEGEAHRNMCCIHENTKLKKKREGKEAAKGVAHSVISRDRINLGCLLSESRAYTSRC
jgi:hypothetical protein